MFNPCLILYCLQDASVSSNVDSVVGDRLFKICFCSQAVETLLEHLELDKRSYRLGLSQVRQK